MADSTRLSLKQARRIALAAQGFADPRPGGTVTARHLSRVLSRVKLLQIDSVNVLQRAHYLPFFSRLGPYPVTLLDRLTQGRRRQLFEYWGHEASHIPLDWQPLFRWRMQRAAQGQDIWSGLSRLAAEKPELIAAVEATVASDGPITASQMEGPRGSGGWWGWSESKQALEYLFWAGRIACARRTPSFERVYDLPQRVLPAEILAAPAPTELEAHRRLLLLAAEAMGVATEFDLRAYFRLRVDTTKAALAALVETGALQPVSVQGWRQQAYLHPGARRPRRLSCCTLLSPFDSLVWDRERVHRLFGFHYRLEFYTPAEKRRFGYYVMPVLLGERLVGRVDVKADRAAGRLLVLGAFAEAGETTEALAEPLQRALNELAAWLDLGGVDLVGEGDLMRALA